MSFFDKKEFRKTPTMARCNVCGAHRSCNTPKMPVTGRGERGVLIVAEAPGKEEDRQGTQLIGQSGQLLREVLGEIDVDLDRDCWKTNAVICWPGEGNPTPSLQRIQQCRPNLIKAIQELKPTTVILLGVSAVKSLIGHLWREDSGSISQWAGWQIPDCEFNAWVCPTFHSAYLLREKSPVLRLWFKRHLKAAFAKTARPWRKMPDYRKRVKIIYDSGEVASLLMGLPDGGGPVAFDYETNMIKPDRPNASIFSCAVAWKASDGVRAIAYPWRGVAVSATQQLLRSEVPKIAANLKFEERWTRRMFGHGVRNWLWDTMQVAHVLDNRPGITSLKFQAFVQFGQGVYDAEVSPYLKGINSDGVNRIGNADMQKVLIYNGMDALLEYKLAELQMRRLGIRRDAPKS